MGKSAGNHILADETEIISLVRGGDYDRFLAIQLAPKAKRAALYALTAFHVEIARVAQTVSEPLIGHIRLAWWREGVEEMVAGITPRNHPVMLALAPLLDERSALGVTLMRMLEARSADMDDALVADEAAWLAYCDHTAGALHRAWALMLDEDAAEKFVDDVAAQARAYAMVGMVRAIPFMAERGWVCFPKARLARHALPSLAPSAALSAFVESIVVEAGLGASTETLGASLRPLTGVEFINRYYMRKLQSCRWNPYQLSRDNLGRVWQIAKLNFL